MATPDGKVTFEAGGVTHTLQFTTNALCLLEEKLDRTTLDVATELRFNPRMLTIRAMFWSALGDTTKTLVQIGEIMDHLGKPVAIQLARDAYAAAFPAVDDEAGGDGENPPKAVAG